MIRTILFIGAGSFFGGISRYLLTRLIQNYTTGPFPVGTMVVNVLGCFLVGLIYALFEKWSIGGNDLKLFLTIGFCGGFTTFSTFVHENYVLFCDRNFLHFLLYATLSFGIGLLFAHLGHQLVKIL